MPDDLDRLRNDLGLFAAAISMPLEPWQVAALALKTRLTAIVAPRQSGKSRSLCVAALHFAFRHPNSRTLIVSAGEDAARRLLAEIAATASESPFLAGSVTDEAAALLRLSNGAEIRSVPASERQVRGWAVDVAIVDEAAIVDSDLILNAVIPTTSARPGAKIVLASSPAGPEGAFYDLARQGDEGVEHVRTFHWDLADATWIQPAAVDAAQASLAPAAFRREMLGEFADVGIDERVIEREWIAQAQGRKLQERTAPVFAVDVARHGGDETIIMRISGGRARVVWAARGLQSIMPIAGQIAALSAAEKGPPPVFWIDADGIGWGVLDRCNQIGGLRVAAFQGGTSAADTRRYSNKRAEAWWITRECLRDAQVDLPADDRLLAAQLGQVTYSLDLAGRIVIQSKKTMRQSPDRGDTLAMAVWAAAGQHRGERIAEMLEQSAREIASAEGPRQSTEAEFAADGGQTTEEAFGGGPRGNWKQRMGWDPDLPIL